MRAAFRQYLYANILSISCLIVLCLFGLSTSAIAQFTTARLTGSAADSAGAAVAGATVQVEQVGTGFTRSDTTDASGQFLFPSLPVGNYRVQVTQPGFESFIQTGITLATGQTVTLPIKLKVGSVSSNVTVEANASMVTTDAPALGQLIDQKQIVNLPLSSRYVQQLVFLVPGAANVTANYCAANCEGGVFPSEQYAKVNGAGANGVSYQLDGADYNDTYINTNLPFPNPDAIQEFNLMTDNMSAAHGDAICDLPFGRGKRFVGAGGLTTALVGGWNVNAIITARGGFPFTVTSSQDYSNSGSLSPRPDRTCSGVGAKTVTNWFNQNCFTTAALATALANGTPRFGNSGRDILTGPGLQEWDVSLDKQTKVKESVSVDFSAGFFNLFNHPNFSNPNAVLGGAIGGQVTNAAAPRDIQFGLKVAF
jgi:hypothetical protein